MIAGSSEEEHDEIAIIVLDGGGELAVDMASGEVIDWPPSVTSHLEFLQDEHARAVDMRKAWDLRRMTLSRALGPELARAGVRRFTGARHHTTWVAPKPGEQCDQSTVTMALAMHFISAEQVDEMRERAARAIKTIPVIVLDEMVAAGSLTAEQRTALVTVVPRGGYARTSVNIQEEPSAAHRQRQQYEEQQ